MKEVTNSTSSAEQRIFEAAGKIFAAKGYKDASVREICKNADVNTAAINYYFGSKEALYIEVVKHWKDIAFEKYPFDFAQDEANPPEERLGHFIKCVLLHTLYEVESPWFGTFMSRESIEPTKAIQKLTEDSIGPSLNILFSIVKKLLGNQATTETVHYYSACILGQCTFYQFSPHIITRHFEIETTTLEDIEKIGDQITRFSLNALQGLSGKQI